MSKKFPVPPECFPVRLSREFRQKTERRQGLFDPNPTPNRPKSRKFPVFSLMIREFGTQRALRIRLRHPPSSLRFSRSLRKNRNQPACSRCFAHLIVAVSPVNALVTFVCQEHTNSKPAPQRGDHAEARDCGVDTNGRDDQSTPIRSVICAARSRSSGEQRCEHPNGRQGLGHEDAGRRQETLSDNAQAQYTRPSRGGRFGSPNQADQRLNGQA